MKKMVLLILLFFVTASIPLFFNKPLAFQRKETTFSSLRQVSNEEKVLSRKVETVSVPVLVKKQNIPNPTAYAALAMDLNSGKVLFEKNPDLELLPASTTKIVTALVAMDSYSLDSVFSVGQMSVEGQKMNLIDGEQISVESLLYGLLVASANDAAEVLAQNYPGGREEFVNTMNKKVNELGFENTYFVNPTGFDGEAHLTTARDLLGISRIVMERPLFREIVATKTYVAKSTDGLIEHKLTNINKLLWEVDGVKGVKTGWTENAKENLVTYFEKDGKRIMVAVLGSDDRFSETKTLIDWILVSYEWKTESIEN